MNIIIDEVNSLKEELTSIGKGLMENKLNSVSALGEKTKDITKVYTVLLGDIEELHSMGVDIPSDILTTQLKNYIEAYKNCDIMMLTDCINFEILSTLDVYQDILEQLIKETGE